MQVRTCDVGHRDPAPPLLAAPDAAAEPEAEREHEALERTASAREDEPLPQVDDADTGVPRRLRRCLPRLDDVGEEAVAPRRQLGQLVVAAVSVEADRRRANDHLRPWLQTRGCFGEQPRAPGARLEDPAFLRLGPPRAEVVPGEVDDRVDAGESVGIDRARLRIPPHLVRSGRLPADDAERLMPCTAKCRKQGRADQARTARDGHPHAADCSRMVRRRPAGCALLGS